MHQLGIICSQALRQSETARSRRHSGGELVLYRFPVDACRKAYHRIRAQQDQCEMEQERHIERHAEDVDDVGIKHIEERARPEEQPGELAASREPHRTQQDWQSDAEIDNMIGYEHLKQLVRRIDDSLVQETGDRRAGHEGGDH